MRRIKLERSVVCLMALIVVVFSSSPALAKPPGESESWLRWPSLPSWKAPSLPKPKEPAFIKATRNGMAQMWTSTKRTTKSAWDKTLYVLRPYDNPPRHGTTSASRADADTGFWASLFSSEPEKKSSPTVNEFLRQPMPF
ncbi:MAG: hypothetical protein KDA72_20145 [Planctomycetales bacterium]|nr:hypothetical protein [Planctomycetales bacterium]